MNKFFSLDEYNCILKDVFGFCMHGLACRYLTKDKLINQPIG